MESERSPIKSLGSIRAASSFVRRLTKRTQSFASRGTAASTHGSTVEVESPHGVASHATSSKAEPKVHVWLDVKDEEAWALARVESQEGGIVKLTRLPGQTGIALPTGVEPSLSLSEAAFSELMPATGEVDKLHTVHDLAKLGDVHLGAVMYTLRQRYAVDEIYSRRAARPVAHQTAQAVPTRPLTRSTRHHAAASDPCSSLSTRTSRLICARPSLPLTRCCPRFATPSQGVQPQPQPAAHSRSRSRSPA